MRIMKQKAIYHKARGLLPYISFLVFILTVLSAVACSESGQGKSFHMKGKETRKVLDPSMFSGMARLAYEAAQEYPDALNEVFC